MNVIPIFFYFKIFLTSFFLSLFNFLFLFKWFIIVVMLVVRSLRILGIDAEDIIGDIEFWIFDF